MTSMPSFNDRLLGALRGFYAGGSCTLMLVMPLMDPAEHMAAKAFIAASICIAFLDVTLLALED